MCGPPSRVCFLDPAAFCLFGRVRRGVASLLRNPLTFAERRNLVPAWRKQAWMTARLWSGASGLRDSRAGTRSSSWRQPIIALALCAKISKRPECWDSSVANDLVCARSVFYDTLCFHFGLCDTLWFQIRCSACFSVRSNPLELGDPTTSYGSTRRQVMGIVTECDRKHKMVQTRGYAFKMAATLYACNEGVA